MKHFVFLFLILGVVLVFAQEGPQPPKPLANEFLKNYVGEWKGVTKSAMGESEDVVTCQMGLNDQFLLMNYKGTSPQMTYEGMGALTIEEKSGQVKGYWIDSMRDMSQGIGKIEGNKLTMTWTGIMGTGTRIEELVDKNTMRVTSNFKMPDGSVMESTSEYKRVSTGM